MSPTDKGSTPESPETPEPNGEPIPGEGAPVEPTVDLTKHESAAEADGTAAADTAPGTAFGSSPVGSDYPAPEDFASANAPAGRNNKLIAIIGGLVVAVVIALVAVLLFVLLKDDGETPEAQIKQVTQEYLDAMNNGKPSEVVPLLCEKVAATAPADLPDQGPQSPQAQIDGFDEITVNGDSANATFTISAIDDDSIPSEQIPMKYENEDGWKICPQ